MRFCNIEFNILNKEQLFVREGKKIKCIVPVNAQVIVLANKDDRYLNFINDNNATFDGEIPLKVAKRNKLRSNDKVSSSLPK